MYDLHAEGLNGDSRILQFSSETISLGVGLSKIENNYKIYENIVCGKKLQSILKFILNLI